MLAHLLDARGVTDADVAAATAMLKPMLARFINGSQAMDKGSGVQNSVRVAR